MEIMEIEDKYSKLKQCSRELRNDNKQILDENQDLMMRLNELIRENQELKLASKSFNQTN